MECKVLIYANRLCRALLFLLTLSTFTLSKAQTGKLYDADKQLSSSFTTQVYLDRDGFLWVATRNGLNKYDGYQFHIIKKEQGQDNGMASNYVNCIAQDKNGLFYVGMYGAFQTYDGNIFRDVEVKTLDGLVVPCYMTCLLVRKNGDVLAGTSGHGLLKTIDRQHAKQVGGELKDVHTVHALMEDQKGHVWIVTNSMGLAEYDGKKVKWYLNTPEQKGILQQVGQDKDGNIYVGTNNHGVYVRKATGGEFQHIDVSGNHHVSALYCNSKGEMMFGYDGQGIGIYNPKNGTLEENPYYSREVDLTIAKTYSIVEDSNGNIWLGLLQKGIYMQPGKAYGFGYMGQKLGQRNIIGTACITSAFIDSRKRGWAGTDKDGLYIFDYIGNTVKHLKDNIPSSILAISEAPDGRIWLGSYGEGLGWVDPTSLQYHPFPQYTTSSVFDLAFTKSGLLWIATMGQGLLLLNTMTGEIKVYAMDEKTAYNPKTNNIANNYISKMSLSPDEKRVYTATTMGLCCLDVEKNSWLTVFGNNCPNYGTPVRIAKEYDKKVWLGTNDGLYCYDLKTKKMERYTTEKGLADNGIASIEQDKEGQLWIGTDHGLCCLNPKTGLTQSFYVDNGLQSNEFSDGASNVTSDGTMIFGGVGGITWFTPSDIQQKQWKAKVQITAFTINGEPVDQFTISRRFQVCDTTVIASNRFELSYHDNSFAIQLSTLTYENPEHITYLYSINGEPYARLQQGNNEITFSHLPPGTYHFKVKAEHNNQSTPVREFTVVVHSPWYRSWFAYCIYLGLLGLAIWNYRKYRKRKEQDRLQLQEHIHAEEMGEAKLRWMYNISHEIRTPMTLIITPLLSLMAEDTDTHRRSVYITIKRNAERILHLINQMMDLRKIDKGMMQMRMQETDLVGFVKEIHTLFEHQANAKHINLVFDHDSDTLPVWIDRGNFDKVIVNILSNAFKFTPAGGEIGIHITHDEHNANIAISDNGECIPEDKLDKIFERFYQNTDGGANRYNGVGTGIGLDLTRSLVELHYGAIKARNLKQGCEFIVSIPLGNAHLKPEEMITGSAPANLASKEMEELSEPVIVPEKRPGERPTIIIAEDDDEIRGFLSQALGQDYNVKTCSNGREALAEVYRTMPDLVISDVMMPEMDGNTLCSQLKSNKSTNHIPIILLTAKSRDEDKLEGLETGANAYLVKPFNMDILRRTIINLLDSHRLLRLKYGQVEKLEEKVEEVKMKSPDQKLMERVMNTVNKHINNSELSVDMIAEEVGISRVHLHRKMKELTGQTPHDFIRSIRLKRAAALLASQKMNITEVVYACGFSNAASFSTMFKNAYGMSPRDYMREHQK